MPPIPRCNARFVLPAHAICSVALVAILSAAATPTNGQVLSDSGTNNHQTGNGDFVVGPEYRIDPDLTERGNPKGKSFEFKMKLADSQIFRGDDATLNPRKKVRTHRRIFVYVPAAYRDGTPAPLLVMHDAPNRLDLVQHALDNLTISHDPRTPSSRLRRHRSRKRRRRQLRQPARTRIRHDVRSLGPVYQR